MKAPYFFYSPDPDDTGSDVATDTNVTTDGEDTSGASDGSATADDSTETTGDNSSGIDTTTGPFLIVDVYSGDLSGKPNWNALVAATNFYGAILKVTQGTNGWSNDGGWFNTNWPALKTSGGSRYGDTWFRGAYLFLNFWQDGEAQADNYLEKVTAAGGWDNGDMFPIIDVELGNDGSNGKPRNRNNDASAQQIIDCTTACADKLRSELGRNIILYGRGAMRERSINDKMGCDAVWNPAYTTSMVRNGLEAWTLDDIVLWQYCGDGAAPITSKKPELVNSIQNFGRPDISVYIEGANKPSFENMKQRLGIGV